MATNPNIHSRLIAEEARRILRPLGMMQKGRSRIWLDDRIWWVGVVEFQPSGFSKGSYLNVGCMWLWHVHAHIGYGVVSRIGQFQSYESEEQFRPTAELLARQAAQEILRLRSQFVSPADVCMYYAKRADDVDLWQSFDVAVASALSGKTEQARRLFDKAINGNKDDYDWVRKARSDAEELSALALKPKRFREVIVERIRKTRELQKLRPIPELEFFLQAP